MMSSVPAFLSKLWTLVEDDHNNDLICWSQEGNSFLVLDEQRFAKDILPKFFKHNNMASFIRQLNMYGFRKVMHMDTGHLVKQERDGPVEFQHPYFKQGQDGLLEHIKRKVSSSRPPDSDRQGQVRQEDLSRLLSSVQNVRGKQEAVDASLTAMKRENEALWREISDLRQKHTHQQQLIKKLIHFIVTLVQNNHILNLKRKRPILMNSSGKKPKYIHQIYQDQSLKGAELTEDVIICDVTQGEEPGDMMDDDITERTLSVLDEGDVEIVEVGLEEVEAAEDGSNTPSHHPEDQEESRVLESGLQINKPSCSSSKQINKPSCSSSLQQINKTSSSSSLQQINKPSSSSSLQINMPSSSSSLQQINTPSSSSSLQQINKPSGGLVSEDPFILMESIMNESAALSQNISLLGKVELMDYLDSIDCSLEDFQAMLFCKPFTDEDLVVSKDNSEQLNRDRLETEDNTDKQLIQYTHCPLLAFLDGGAMEQQASSSTAPLTDPAPSTDLLLNSSPCSSSPPVDLLEEQQELSAPRSTALVRLEPLTEAQASQQTLFELCELSPQCPLGDTV